MTTWICINELPSNSYFRRCSWTNKKVSYFIRFPPEGRIAKWTTLAGKCGAPEPGGNVRERIRQMSCIAYCHRSSSSSFFAQVIHPRRLMAPRRWRNSPESRKDKYSSRWTVSSFWCHAPLFEIIKFRTESCSQSQVNGRRCQLNGSSKKNMALLHRQSDQLSPTLKNQTNSLKSGARRLNDVTNFLWLDERKIYSNFNEWLSYHPPTPL